MAWNISIFVILALSSYEANGSLMSPSLLRSNQGFQRQSLVGYHQPQLRLDKQQQNLLRNKATERWVLNKNDDYDEEDTYLYGSKRYVPFGNSELHPLVKRHFGRRQEYYGPPPLLSQFVRPQGPRRERVGTAADATYDVPQIECPDADNGLPRFACPSSDEMGRYRCIDDRTLCDGFIDCPMGEDEDRQACMYYKMTKSQINLMSDLVLRLTRGRK